MYPWTGLVSRCQLISIISLIRIYFKLSFFLQGSRSRQKVVVVSGITTDQVLAKLKGEMDN